MDLVQLIQNRHKIEDLNKELQIANLEHRLFISNLYVQYHLSPEDSIDSNGVIVIKQKENIVTEPQKETK